MEDAVVLTNQIDDKTVSKNGDASETDSLINPRRLEDGLRECRVSKTVGFSSARVATDEVMHVLVVEVLVEMGMPCEMCGDTVINEQVLDAEAVAELASYFSVSSE